MLTSKILIEPVFRTGSAIPLPFIFTKNFVVQAEPFKCGVKISNIGDEPSQPFNLKQIKFKSAAGQNIIHTVDKTFHIDILNPGAKSIVWIDKLGTYMSGQALLEMTIVSAISGDIIETYQKDIFAKQIQKFSDNNHWMDFFYIRSRAEVSQDFNNSIILWLTLLTVVLALSTFLQSYRSIQQEQEKRAYEAHSFCKANPEGTWPKATGGTISCAEVLTITK